MKYRRLKLQDLLREEISSIILRDIKDPGFGLITILDVAMTEDLKHAKVYYSIYGSDEDKEKTANALKRSRGYIKFLLGERLKLRSMPDIAFVIDDSYEKLARLDAILKKEAHDRED
jgi:ribosome-binding factor A